MGLDYKSIREENEKKYGTDIGRIGRMLLADRYDDRTHFLFELLQNAEDALALRTTPTTRRSIRFHLTHDCLRVTHCGKPFDEGDVRGICGIAESSKGLTSIGRFGIGFKSVYAFTDRPEVHSGDEHFAIESFVWPVEIQLDSEQHSSEETSINLRLRDAADAAEVQDGLKRLGARTLLFLREIEEIEWKIEGGHSGLYLRNQPDELAENVRRITILGQATGSDEIEETWLLFSSPVATPDGEPAGYVEVGFLLDKDSKSARPVIRPLPRSPLVVFFPTVFETHLGFLVQGPYVTTPSRDNIPSHHHWNQHCVQETKDVVLAALRWLRENDLLDVNVWRCLPLERSKFPIWSMFAPIFDVVKEVASREPFIPRHGGGHIAGEHAVLARSQELRDLLDASQLATILKAQSHRHWVRGDVSEDRTPEIFRYLTQELGVEELRPESVLPKLTAEFLEQQSDDWIAKLYSFLSIQKALASRAKNLPLVRLASGKHVLPFVGGRAQAFLPASFDTAFPTVRKAVCATDEAREFLRALGLTEPDPVDDVIWNVLPRYKAGATPVSDEQYAADIQRILAAYRTDSDRRRKGLIEALSQVPFVRTVEAGGTIARMARATETYLATERLQALFEGCAGVNLVDRQSACLQGEDVRTLLEACGAVRHLRPVESNSMSWQEMGELRKKSGHGESSGYSDRVTDWVLQGLERLLALLPSLPLESRRTRANLLWEELAHVEERRGKGVFSGDYSWTHYGKYSTQFDAAFVRLLNEKAWVPDGEGDPRPPSQVPFETLGWKAHPFLQSKLLFKPPIIDQLAAEAGIEPGVLDLLRKLGVTTESELKAMLKLKDSAPEPEDSPADQPDEGQEDGPAESADEEHTSADAGGAKQPDGGAAGGESSVGGSRPDQGGLSGAGSSGGNSKQSNGQAAGAGSGSGGPRPAQGSSGGTANSSGGSKPGSSDNNGKGAEAKGAPPFVSYIGVDPGSKSDDGDGSTAEHRREVEEAAIRFVLDLEKELVPMPYGNPGFDLYERDDNDAPKRWVEVKGIAAPWKGREVVLTRDEFDCARQHRADYWLYVVEHATDPEQRRLIRIQDPAGQARNFKFDHGWSTIGK